MIISLNWRFFYASLRFILLFVLLFRTSIPGVTGLLLPFNYMDLFVVKKQFLYTDIYFHFILLNWLLS